jgi:hypothetical protein
MKVESFPPYIYVPISWKNHTKTTVEEPLVWEISRVVNYIFLLLVSPPPRSNLVERQSDRRCCKHRLLFSVDPTRTPAAYTEDRCRSAAVYVQTSRGSAGCRGTAARHDQEKLSPLALLLGRACCHLCQFIRLPVHSSSAMFKQSQQQCGSRMCLRNSLIYHIGTYIYIYFFCEVSGSPC